MYKILIGKGYVLSIVIAACGLLLIIGITHDVTAQGKRSVPGEMATCNIRVVNEVSNNSLNDNARMNTAAGKEIKYKNYQPKLNQLGHFDLVSNLQPLQTVPIEIRYPEGIKGEKVAILVADGGTIDNEGKAKVIALSDEKKITFDFQVAKDPGLYRVLLRRANDVKVIRLWVGREPLPIRN